MSRHRETNPHFDPSLTPQPPVPSPQQPHRGTDRHSSPPPAVPYPQQPHHGPSLHSPPRREGRRKKQAPQPQYSPRTDHFPIHQPPQQQTPRRPETHFPTHQTPQHQTPRRPEARFPISQTSPQHQTQHQQPQHVAETHFPLHPAQPQHPTQPVQPQHPTQPVHAQTPPTTPRHRPQPPPSSLRVPPPQKTRAYHWLIGVFCAFFWVAVILGGIVVLIVYLLFRPRSPKFDISNASLNAAYLDMGYLLNADLTLLVNFTNPSKKATVDFSYMFINLYFQNTLISTSYVEPFSALKAESKFRSVHLVSSQVALPAGKSQRLQRQIENNRVRLEVTGVLRTRSNLGSLFRYSYRLYGHCIIEVTAPPIGILVGKKCTTKR